MILIIKESLYGNKDKIKYILEELGCYNIEPSGRYLRFGLDNEGQGNGNSINIDTLGFHSFSSNKKGDIITLGEYMLGIKFDKVIKWFASKLNLTYEKYEKIEVELPFGGFWKKFSRIQEIDESPAKTYDDEEYLKYATGVSLRFIKDGISAKTQEEFGLGYDHLSNRTTIPWFDCENSLVGIMGRLNKDDIKEKENKYLPIIPFSKKKVLYGFNVNYKGILESNTIIICESEKSVLKARQYGFNNVVALGGNEIHPIPQKLIKSMYCNAVVALDEGIGLKHCIEQAKKLQIKNPFFINDVYVLDMQGLEHKSCIFDLSRDIIEKAFKERLIYID